MVEGDEPSPPKASKPKEELDPSFYTWSNWFKIQLGTSSREEDIKYANYHAAKNEEADCKRCEKYKTWLFNNSPLIRFMREQIRDTADGPDINPSTVHCQRCPLQMGSKGAFSPKYGIMLCANMLPTRTKMEETLAHEMVHAYDHVRFDIDRMNLRHVACGEVRAVMLSGECRFWRQWGNGYGFARGWEKCVKMRAALTLRKHPACKSDVQAAKVINEVWASCSADTRPFDEVFK